MAAAGRLALLLGRALDYVGAKKRWFCCAVSKLLPSSLLATLNSDPSVCICCVLTGASAYADKAGRLGPLASMFTLGIYQF